MDVKRKTGGNFVFLLLRKKENDEKDCGERTRLSILFIVLLPRSSETSNVFGCDSPIFDFCNQ